VAKIMEVLEINKKNLNSIIKKAVQILDDGEIIIIPTDTVYGITCKWNNKNALKEIFNIKRRVLTKPIPILISDIKMLKTFNLEINEKMRKFLMSKWPGSVTVIIDVNNDFPFISKNRKIGFRMPASEFCLKVISELGYPIAATSANISGKEPIVKKGQLIETFENDINCLIYEKQLRGNPSSVIIYQHDKIKKLR
jgi:L-threonylcarbamoyladenylate synthase